MSKNAKNFTEFQHTVNQGPLQHEVITRNPYTKWFKRGHANPTQVIDLMKQFSVFSNYFLAIQAKRMVHSILGGKNRTAESVLAAENGARNILTSELGVGMDVATGETEGRPFSHRMAHINWLRKTAAPLGIPYFVLGRWDIGRPSTHKFLLQLEQCYGSHDPDIGAGASFAIETWAAFGIGGTPEQEMHNFWKELIVGLGHFNNTRRISQGLAPIPLDFFQFHFDIERGHGANVLHELKETFDDPDFNQRKWLQGAWQALDALHIFWAGLDRARKKLVAG